MSNPKVVLITGASSGNGQRAAELLSQQGYQVFGTRRNPVSSEREAGYTFITLDVCSDDSVHACVQSVLDQAGCIDVLVNNAGYELAGALEELSLEEAHAQFETNFFGVVRMVKAVLPGMRQRKSGQIINVSSLAGLSTTPFLGMYAASKFALEGYTEALRLETHPFHILVSMIEPGFLHTPMMSKKHMATQHIHEYAPWKQRALNAIHEYEEKGPNADLVAKTILKIIETKRPRLRYIVGQQAKLVSRLRQFLPEPAFEMGTRSTFHLDVGK